MMNRVATPVLQNMVACVVVALSICPAMAQDENEIEPGAELEVGGDETSLARAAQNPIADLISLPFQNNFNFNQGPRERTQWIMNIQPVIPIKLNDRLNLITRTILPVINQPSLAPGMSSTFGVGDLNASFFFSPVNNSNITWGAGPVVSLPTATDDVLGTGKVSLGVSGVVLAMPGKFVVGGLVSNLWSVAGEGGRDDVNFFLAQPFVNYNIKNGWYLTSSPIITANWEASSSDQWTIPIGGGVGKIFRIGKQPINMSLQAFENVEKPSNAADWQLRLQIQLLFPKG